MTSKDVLFLACHYCCWCCYIFTFLYMVTWHFVTYAGGRETSGFDTSKGLKNCFVLLYLHLMFFFFFSLLFFHILAFTALCCRWNLNIASPPLRNVCTYVSDLCDQWLLQFFNSVHYQKVVGVLNCVFYQMKVY